MPKKTYSQLSSVRSNRSYYSLTVANKGLAITIKGLCVAIEVLTASIKGLIVANRGLTVAIKGLIAANNGLSVVIEGLTVTIEGLTVVRKDSLQQLNICKRVSRFSRVVCRAK